MKPTKMRNQQRYATATGRQLFSHLSKDMQKKYSRRSARVIEGDTVKVIRGEYRGVEGNVAKIDVVGGRIAIESVQNTKKRGDKYDVFIHSSNIILTNLNTDDKWREKKLRGEKGEPSKPAETEQAPDDNIEDGQDDDSGDIIEKGIESEDVKESKMAEDIESEKQIAEDIEPQGNREKGIESEDVKESKMAEDIESEPRQTRTEKSKEVEE